MRVFLGQLMIAKINEHLFGKRNKKQQQCAEKIPTGDYTLVKNIEYFEKNVQRPFNPQVVNYTWEKPSEKSPSMFRTYKNENLKQNTLDLMATYEGYPHLAQQNKWESEPSGPPEFRSYPETRRTVVLSAMTQ
jgi:hypothetical protein